MQVIMHEGGLIEIVSEDALEYRLLQRMWVHGIEVVEHDNHELYQSITIREREDDDVE